VRIFVMGGGSGRRTPEGRLDHGGAWLAARRWPPEAAEATRLHLDAEGGLAAVRPRAAGARSYCADPERPVPTIGGPITSGEPVMRGGAFDQHEAPGFFGCRPPYLPLASRPDVLVFETPPLKEAVTIAGDVAVVLSVASDRPTTDFTAKLVDVYPPSPHYPRGYAMNLCDGILRACFRNGFERPEPLVPGEVVQVRIALYPTANRFLPGHRIRLEIASSNFPRFDVNPNFSVAEDLAAGRVTAVNTLHFGPDRPAYLEVFRLGPER
jgi:uncharacterized protein